MDRGFGAAVSISGSRPDENAYILDGASINDYANGAPGSVLGDNLGIDAVQQVAVLGSNYPAEYGRILSGGVSHQRRNHQRVGCLSRFGIRIPAQQRTGCAEFLRSGPAVNSRLLSGNQFGGSAGGCPIRKGRTFIFGDYEGAAAVTGRHNRSIPYLSPAARTGMLTFCRSHRNFRRIALLQALPISVKVAVGSAGREVPRRELSIPLAHRPCGCREVISTEYSDSPRRKSPTENYLTDPIRP